MSPKILLIAGFLVLLASSSLCGYEGCDQTVKSKQNLNGGIKSGGQGISAGKNVNSNGGVNVNGNNGAGIAAVQNSVISSVNKGKTNVNTAKNSAIGTSGKLGATTQNSGVISSGKKGVRGLGGLGGLGGYGYGYASNRIVNTLGYTGYNGVVPVASPYAGIPVAGSVVGHEGFYEDEDYAYGV